MKFIYRKYKGDKTVYYLDEYMSVDTETSDNKDPEHPECWVNTIQVRWLDKEYIFRKPMQFIGFLKKIIKTYDLQATRRIIIIIHNMSFDMAFLMPYINLYLPYREDYTILNDGKKIKAYRQGGLDFRDTLILSGKSLEKWGKDFNIEHQKQVGLYDYSEVIYQDTELDPEQLKYDLYDVIGLDECYEKQLQLEGDTTASIPFTATGYIRRDFRSNAINNKEYMRLFHASALSCHQFELNLRSYSGGFTHQNRFLKSHPIYGLIGHRDFRSHYPTQMRCYPLPFGKIIELYSPMKYERHRRVKWTIEEILGLYPKYTTITVLMIEKAQLKDKNITMPFMQFSKMYTEGSCRYTCDNGRVLSFEGKARLYVPSLTLKILHEQYDIKGKILEILAMENMYMPSCLADTIDKLFKGKSDEKLKLKAIEKAGGEFSEEWFQQSAKLLHVKGGLNGTYGMFVQNPIHEEYNIDFTREDYEHIFDAVISPEMTPEMQLAKYYNNRNSFLPYQVGCAVTDLARYELYEYIKCIGYDKVIYADTDSLFYLKSPETELKIEALNKLKHEQAEKLGAFITDDSGKRIYYDVFEDEPDCIAFKGLHAKCYGIIQREGSELVMKATIAGIPARTLIEKRGEELIYLTREEELCGITPDMKKKNPKIKVLPFTALKHITDRFIFRTNTGTAGRAVMHPPKVVNIEGHEIETAGGWIITKLPEKKIKDFDIYDYEEDPMRGVWNL